MSRRSDAMKSISDASILAQELYDCLEGANDLIERLASVGLHVEIDTLKHHTMGRPVATPRITAAICYPIRPEER